MLRIASMKTRLMLAICGVSIVSTLCIGAYFIVSTVRDNHAQLDAYRADLEDSVGSQLKGETEVAYGILEEYYKKQQAGELTEEQAKKEAADRVRDLNIKIDMDFSKETKDSTVYHPITIREDNPDTPYDDSEFRDTLPISQQTVTREWQGTGFNPQGPAGTEGQTPPVYSDMSNVIGKQTETGVTQNNALNTDQIHREESPRYGKVTVSVNIDGIWTKKYDKNHNPVFNDQGGIVRDYAPVPKEQLEQWADYIQSAIGYDRAKGYKVTVINVPFDRSAEFEAEDAAILKARQTRLTIILVLIGLAAILAIFILYRFISREMERRRRLREEELLRKQQAARDQALWEAKEEGVEVTMSVEERKRAELQENAIAMAKEHPEDVAMLIRTWLMEE